MKFEWDDNKNRSNYEKHGLSFEEAALIFQDTVLTHEDTRHDYGETRKISIGKIQNIVCITTVHTDRSGITRIISARPANKKERRAFDEYYQKITG